MKERAKITQTNVDGLGDIFDKNIRQSAKYGFTESELHMEYVTPLEDSRWRGIDLEYATPQSPRVSIIIPTLNEEKNICEIVSRLRDKGYDDILIIDGHSKDGTVECAKRLGANVILK